MDKDTFEKEVKAIENKMYRKMGEHWEKRAKRIDSLLEMVENLPPKVRQSLEDLRDKYRLKDITIFDNEE